MSTQTQSFLQGEIVDGKYELRQYLGGSDRGPVFLTEFGNLRRHAAAIKLVRVRAGNAELQLSRWRLAANLLHPHLIRIFDMGRCEVENAGMLYVVTEQADENVAQIIPERALTADEVREMLVPLLDALTFMHSRGFVHTRIKPSNIMAVGEQLKLSSDSILHLAESPDSAVQASAYDPPESTRGGVFPAGDIWSLGVTLVEVLTQEFPAWNPADRKEPVLPATLPEPFVDIVRHSLRRDPKSRWTAADITAHLPRKALLTLAPTAQVQPDPAQAAVPEPRPIAPAAVRTDSVAGKQSIPTRKYAIGATAAGLLLVTLFAAMKLVRREPATQNPPVAAAEPRANETPQPPAFEHSKPTPTRQAAQVARTRTRRNERARSKTGSRSGPGCTGTRRGSIDAC